MELHSCVLDFSNYQGFHTEFIHTSYIVKSSCSCLLFCCFTSHLSSYFCLCISLSLFLNPYFFSHFSYDLYHFPPGHKAISIKSFLGADVTFISFSITLVINHLACKNYSTICQLPCSLGIHTIMSVYQFISISNSLGL